MRLHVFTDFVFSGVQPASFIFNFHISHRTVKSELKNFKQCTFEVTEQYIIINHWIRLFEIGY